MSKLLSQIHYRVFDKISYIEHVNKKLAELTGLEYLPIVSTCPLEEQIDIDHIHDWLSNAIQCVEKQHCYFIETAKIQGITDQLMALMTKEGKKVAIHQVANCNEAFQYLQTYQLDGMPCDKGVVLLSTENNAFCFQIEPFAHSQIKDFYTFLNMRKAWIQGVLQHVPFSVTTVAPHTLCITKEE